jgi:Caspase domain
MKWLLSAVLAVAALLSAPIARADVRRVAVVVGSNAGSGERPALRYAEADAEKIAQVLVELGGFGRSDVYLLRGAPMNTVREVLAAVREKIALWHAETPHARLMLLFYFSGHSNGRQLEVGSDRFEFSELKEWMAASGSDVRLAIIDSCKSGTVLGTKGGVPGQAFDIQLTDSLATSGEAVLTSSAADESALESEELRGSFFSHSLVSGLRGAADANRDGHVTLAEAYQHAFARTLAETSNTVYGPQHPGYDYRLSGQGDLVLTEFSRPPAALDLPAGFDRILVTNSQRDQIVAECGPDAARRISVQPGEYAIRAFRGKDLFGGTFVVARGETRTVPAADLTPSQGETARAKGAAPERDEVSVAPSASEPRWAVGLLGGGMAWVGESAPALVGARLGVSSRQASSPLLGVEVATSVTAPAGSEPRETIATVGAGYRLGVQSTLGRWTLRPSAGAEIAGGIDKQSSTGVVAALGPQAGIELGVGSSLSLSALARAPIYVGRRTEEFAVRWAPSAWVGMVLGL